MIAVRLAIRLAMRLRAPRLAAVGLLAVLALWAPARGQSPPAAGGLPPCEPPVCVIAPAAWPTCASPIRPQDEVWVMSSRHLDCPDGRCDIVCWRWQAGRGWLAASVDEFLAAHDPERVTCFWLHGNRIDAADAVAVGALAYRGLAVPDAAPMRYVVWSWPTDRMRGQLRDIRAKAARAAIDAQYLAQILRRMHPDVPVGLFGYSYGSRVIAAALHLLGGGRLGEIEVATAKPARASSGAIDRHAPAGAERQAAFSSEAPDREVTAASRVASAGGAASVSAPARRIRAVLMVPALDDDWLLECGSYASALAQTERMLVMHNSRDRALRWYHVPSGKGRRALGYRGIAFSSALPHDGAGRYEQLDAFPYVGRRHDWQLYLTAAGVLAAARDVLLESWTHQAVPSEDHRAAASRK